MRDYYTHKMRIGGNVFDCCAQKKNSWSKNYNSKNGTFNKRVKGKVEKN